MKTKDELMQELKDMSPDERNEQIQLFLTAKVVSSEIQPEHLANITKVILQSIELSNASGAEGLNFDDEDAETVPDFDEDEE